MYYYQKEKHKVFFSFYHHDDQWYKNYIDKYLSGDIINKSVKDGEYNTDISDEYIKRLIREDKISDSSVIVVLVGPNTRKRKHVDWEIYAGLRASVNGSAGLIGVLLPEFPLLYENKYKYNDLPARLADNVKSGYAGIYTWEDFKQNYLSIITETFENRIDHKEMIDNSRIQMKRNLGENE
ncbi:TIR domain-containing protein [Butyrivibrio sp. INlla16]|uniref:TIR domain-containing protein n=1 Tax=Butyrivibrio sp. INlla16 TaxID=1520807 RepID=UPI00087F19BC|nr:TIR domain-containing protein [Butyrivibrio sp. INlla16]SDB63119.1 MTH538 TIR-like domain [Butyrivibrio sp. INlla16]